MELKSTKQCRDIQESPRILAKMINKIITDLGFTACKHESCIYFYPSYKWIHIYFIRQVDDSAIGCKDRSVVDAIINIIDSTMTIKLKPLGIISRFYCIDVTQTRNYIKISNETYLNKILEYKLKPSKPPHSHPIIMNSNLAYNCRIKKTTPLTDKELQKIERRYNFSYRQGIKELIYGMVTFIPDILFLLIKLIQCSTRPALEHSQVV